MQVRAIAIAQDLARTRGEQEPSQDSWSAAWKQALCELESKLDALGSAFKSTLVRGRCLRHRLLHCDICRDDARSATRKSTGPRSCSAASVVPSVSGGAAPLSLRLVVMGGGAPFVATPARAVRACLRCNGDTGGVQLRLLPVDAVADAAAAAAIAGAAAGDPRYHVVRCNATKRAREGGSSGGGAHTLPRMAGRFETGLKMQSLAGRFEDASDEDEPP